jgi:tryptophan 7-halogenase
MKSRTCSNSMRDEHYDPLVDLHTHVDAARLLAGLRQSLEEAARALPSHRQYIERHCRAAIA